MEKPNQIDTEKYIEKIERSNLELGDDGKELEYGRAWFRLGKSFDRIVREKGKITIDFAGFSIEEWFSDVRDDPDFDAGVKKLEKLILRDNKGKTDVLETLSGVPDIYYDPKPLQFDGGALLHLGDRKIIFIHGDISVPRNFIILLHEIGHFIDSLNLERLGVKSMMTEGDNSEIAEMIRKERMADAFVFKVMRPFVKDKQLKDDIHTFINEGSLATYYHGAKKKIADQKNST